MRIPENRVHEVQNLIEGGDLESVTESVESVTSKAEPIRDIRRIVERWGEKLVLHQDPINGQVKQPRWSKCWEMWQEHGVICSQRENGGKRG